MTAHQTTLKCVTAALGLSLLLVSAPSRADDFYWNNEGGGWWDDPTNWLVSGAEPSGIPQEGDTVFLTQSYFGIGVFYRSPDNPLLGGLYIDSNNGLNQRDIVGGDLITDFEIVGWDGRGVPGGGGAPPEGRHSQSGGTNQVQNQLTLGYENEGRGNYVLTQTGQLQTGSTVIGRAGLGNFTQSGASHQVETYLILGQESTGTGTYNLSGSLSVGGGVSIGGDGTGEFEQTSTGSVHTIASELVLGRWSAGEGTYRLSGGELHVAPELGSSSPPHIKVVGDVVIVGQSGVGNFEQSGGSHFIGNPDRPSSTAWLTLGKYTGTSVDSSGTYRLSDGQLIVYGGTRIGENGGGAFIQTGGTHHVGVGRGGYLSENSYFVGFGDLELGADIHGDGRYELQEGDLIVSPTVYDTSDPLPGTTAIFGGRIELGSGFIFPDGTGEFIQSGGTATAHRMIVGNGSRYELIDGSLTLREEMASNTAGIRTPQGGSCSINGLFAQEGGEFAARRVTTSEDGTYDLQAGSLAVNLSVEFSDPNAATEAVINEGTFNYSGGDIVLRRGTLVGEEFDESSKGVFDNRYGYGAHLNVSGSGTRVLDGDLRNAGTVTLSDTTLRVTGDYTGGGDVNDLGLLELDPSAIYFEGDVTNEPGAYFVADAGSSFQMGADFLNHSEQLALWDTDDASLIFDGEDPVEHIFALAGADLGATLAGFVDNFAFGSLALADDDTLTLVDGNAIPDAALYISILAEFLDLDDITSPYNIYYDLTRDENAWLGGQNYQLNGGGWVMGAVPEPGTLPLICLGLAGIGYLRKHGRKAA